MSKSSHFIKVERTAQYFVLQASDQDIKSILYVLHGYSQLAEFFIEHFKNLSQMGLAVVAPSALSFHYQTAFSGRVGASWMTKHNREKEIEDYINYLERLHKEVQKQFPAVENFSILGFSQGTATATRWFAKSRIHFEQLIYVAGGLAEDIDWAVFRQKLQSTELHILYGDNDQFIDEAYIEKQKEFLKGMEYELTVFKGKHIIPKAELELILGKNQKNL